jgi:hypothetical protein
MEETKIERMIIKIKKFIIYIYNKYNYYFNFFLIILRIIKIINNLYDPFLLNEIDNNDNKNKNWEVSSQFFTKQNIVRIIFKGTYPLRHLFYLWISYKASDNLTNNNDIETITTILTVIEIIDKSIITIMDEIAEDEIEKTFNKENEDIFTDNTNNKDDIDFTKK